MPTLAFVVGALAQEAEQQLRRQFAGIRRAVCVVRRVDLPR